LNELDCFERANAKRMRLFQRARAKSKEVFSTKRIPRFAKMTFLHFELGLNFETFSHAKSRKLSLSLNDS